MKAKVTKQFAGRPDDEVVTRQILVDEEISGDLARVAINNGWAKPIDADAKAAAPKKTRTRK